MKQKSKFFSENVLLAVSGHLFVVALMVTSFAIVADKMVIAPEHVQITEIDLSQVDITPDNTQVFNTDLPEQKEEPVKEEPKKEQPEQGNDKPIEKPAMVTPPKKKVAKPVQAPKKKMLVRVNRETTSLNRSMTISVIDALRVALTRCWTIDRSRPDIADIRAVAHLAMYQNGRVADLWFEGAAQAETYAAFAYVIETIKTAIVVCQPFSMLPPSEYDSWKNIQLTFYPSNKEIQ